MESLKRVAEPSEMEPKRQKVAEESKVLHVRGLPTYTTETELVAMVSQFGRVVKTLILHDKNQAFVQMDSLDSAMRAVAALSQVPPTIRNKTVYVQYSSRQEVDHKVPMTTAVGGVEGVFGPLGVTPDGGAAAAAFGAASPTLIIMVTNVTVPVTLENVYQICKPYGEVLRIITFNKGLDFQALVEFQNAEHAALARTFLDGKDLFQGCCHLRVSFSKRQTLVVKQNDHKSRDFSRPELPQGTGLISQAGYPLYGDVPMNPGMSQDRSPVVLVSNLDEKASPEVLFVLFGVYGDVLRVKILFKKKDTALIQFASHQQAEFARVNLNGCPLYGRDLNVASSKYMSIQMPREEEGKELTRDFTGSELHRYKGKALNPRHMNRPSAVLHVANIAPETSEQELSELFQPASSVPVVVEFFQTSRNQAYVALGNVAEGVNAVIHYHNHKLRDYPLRVSFSPKSPEALAAAAFSSSATSLVPPPHTAVAAF